MMGEVWVEVLKSVRSGCGEVRGQVRKSVLRCKGR